MVLRKLYALLFALLMMLIIILTKYFHQFTLVNKDIIYMEISDKEKNDYIYVEDPATTIGTTVEWDSDLMYKLARDE